MRPLTPCWQNFKRYLFLVCTGVLVGCLSPSLQPEQVAAQQNAPSLSVPAFPGAEGYGAQSIGGRGGQIIAVTTLDDSGPGSLRAAIEATGPRIVVFRVAGTIELFTPLVIENPYITIAGQSAPGGGITLKSHATMDDAPLEISTQHVVIRYLRIRPGATSALSHNVDALIISREAQHIMIDHSSFSWASDENISIWYNARNITIQWSIISEALLNSTHDAGPQGYGLLIGDQTGDISLHHNLLAHNHRRNPRVTGGNIDIINNVIYNPGSTPSRLIGDSLDGNPTGGRYNYIGNYLKAGPDSIFDYEVKIEALNGAVVTAFLDQNIGPHRPDDTQPNQEIVHPDGRHLLVPTLRSGPFITTTSAQTAYDQVLANSGATLPMRDAVDLRVVDEVRDGTGQIIDDPADVGGWPELAPGTPAADSDQDGMPDAWEISHNLLPADPADGPLDSDGDGYTNVEEFLNNSDPRGAPASTFHIGKLTGLSIWQISNQPTSHEQWGAKATIFIENEHHAPLPNAMITGRWNNDAASQDSCKTNENGSCTIDLNQLAFQPDRAAGSVTFLITDVTHSSATYAPDQNHQAILDPEIPQPGVTIFQPIRFFFPYLQWPF